MKASSPRLRCAKAAKNTPAAGSPNRPRCNQRRRRDIGAPVPQVDAAAPMNAMRLPPGLIGRPAEGNFRPGDTCCEFHRVAEAESRTQATVVAGELVEGEGSC